MGQSSAQISLDEFILEMGREPVSSRPHERLMDLTRRLAISSELIESRTRFTAHTYTRNLVCRSADLELLVLSWRPGHESTIHDHAGSLNAIRVDRDGIHQLANTSDEHLVTVHVYPCGPSPLGAAQRSPPSPSLGSRAGRRSAARSWARARRSRWTAGSRARLSS